MPPIKKSAGSSVKPKRVFELPPTKADPKMPKVKEPKKNTNKNAGTK